MKKPYFWTARKAWYIKTDDGKNLRLAEDQAEAFRLYGRMLELSKFRDPDATINAIAEAWLTEHHSQVCEERFTDSVRILKSFCLHIGPSYIARDIMPSQVHKWLKEHEWSDSRRSDAVRRVKAVLRWSFENGWLPKNPLASLKMPAGKPRSQLVAPDLHSEMIKECQNYRSRHFIPFLIALRLSGARPTSIRDVRAEHVSPDGMRWVLPVHKTVGKTGKPLVIYLPPCLQTLTKILKHHRKGFLFTNRTGIQYTKNAVVHTMRRLRLRLKIEGKVIAYSYRHTYATEMLTNGESLATVAALMGHQDTSMVSKVYGHLEQQSQHMQQAVDRGASKRVL